jgi:hypothetical protein
MSHRITLYYCGQLRHPRVQKTYMITLRILYQYGLFSSAE